MAGWPFIPANPRPSGLPYVGFNGITEFNLESEPEEPLGDCGGEGGWPRRSFAVDVDIAC